jgi:hypothetical protein
MSAGSAVKNLFSFQLFITLKELISVEYPTISPGNFFFIFTDG